MEGFETLLQFSINFTAIHTMKTNESSCKVKLQTVMRVRCRNSRCLVHTSCWFPRFDRSPRWLALAFWHSTDRTQIAKHTSRGGLRNIPRHPPSTPRRRCLNRANTLKGIVQAIFFYIYHIQIFWYFEFFENSIESYDCNSNSNQLALIQCNRERLIISNFWKINNALC